MHIIETERLLLRELALDDLDELAPIFADPEMMRFYPAPFSRERTQGWIEWALRSYAEHGHGLWALVRKADGRLLGDCGIIWQTVEGERWREIGYHVRREDWGRGYASEAALACRDYAFAILGAERICSLVDPENHASRAVAGRVHQAMRMVEWERLPGQQYCFYHSQRPAAGE